MQNADAGRLFLDLFPFYKYIGLEIESASDGVYRCRVPLNANTGNHMMTMHAAVQWAVAEFLGGLVVVSVIDLNELPNIYGAVKSATINFLKAVRTDIIAEARVEDAETQRIKDLVAKGEEATFMLDPVLRDVDGRAVAAFHAEYVVRPRRK
jgi:acyl-coenzyme A thioesterase PaaI-like protein